jgi:hypothetical protein
MKGLYDINPVSVKLIGVSVFIIVLLSSVSIGEEDLPPDVAIVVEVSGKVTYELHENIKKMVAELLQKYPENPVLKQWEEEYGKK